MLCIYCGSETNVINSRPQKRLNHIWRRRKCANCGAIFTTTEIPDLFKSLSVKKSGHLQPFSRDKLLLSINASLKHLKQPTNDASSLTDTILSKLLPLVKDASLTSEQIIATTLLTLNHFDKPASTHYAAFHPQEFSDNR